VVFAKTPTPGQVKTRLTPIIHAREAADLARSLLLDTVQAGDGAGFETVVAFTPATGRRLLERLLGPRRRLVAQGGGDLGVRLARVTAIATDGRPRPVIVVGTDCPAVTAERLREAQASLERSDLVLGPALDGGFYLIGLRGSRPELFEDIPWSTADTLERVEARARAAELRVTRLEPARDLDTPEDLYEWYVGAQAAILREKYPHTSATLHAMLPPRRLAALEAAVRGEEPA
jgi:rSAM/selenodomain-associated transferase 1